MTRRLYYTDSFLHSFDATVAEVLEHGGRPAVVLDQTAFYPTSGGQVFDTGVLEAGGGEQKLKVTEVAEIEGGHIVHYLEAPAKIEKGAKVHGVIDAARRRDHMQQHTGQHVLSAAFERLYNMPTVSFHMGADSCTIDLAAPALSAEQAERAEKESNRVLSEDRPVEIRFVGLEEAKKLGLRKLPDVGKEELRLIEIRDWDLCACGGTHARSTGQIGVILLRKVEKVKQGVRVEFVCGDRAVVTARRDYRTLVEAAGLYSTHIYEVPAQIRKSLEEAKAARKIQAAFLEELAELQAAKIVGEAPGGKLRIVTGVFPDRDLAFVKLMAQKMTGFSGVVALLATTASHPAGLVFAQSVGGALDMNALLKQAVAALGGRGGGTHDLAQGSAADAAKLKQVLEEVASKVVAPPAEAE